MLELFVEVFDFQQDEHCLPEWHVVWLIADACRSLVVFYTAVQVLNTDMLLQEENTYLISQKPQRADEIAGTFNIKNSADTMLRDAVHYWTVVIFTYLYKNARMVYGKFFDCALRWISHYIQKLNIAASPVTINLPAYEIEQAKSWKWKKIFYQGIFQDRPKPSDTGGNNHNGPLLTWKRRFMSYKILTNVLKWLGCIFPISNFWNSTIEVQRYEADNKPKRLPVLKKAIIAGWGKVIFPTYQPPDEAAPRTTPWSISTAIHGRSKHFK